MLDPLFILAALACGIASRALGLPALIGYLAAGFLMHEIELDGGELLHTLSGFGITLLLFTIGLKLEVKKLLEPRVWGTTPVNMAALQLIFMGVLFAADALFSAIELDLDATLVIALALFLHHLDDKHGTGKGQGEGDNQRGVEIQLDRGKQGVRCKKHPHEK